jgi:ADP-heptose:LPS heptosyltransferase
MSSSHKHPKKILAIQFKYLGDAVFITPALQALHFRYPEAEIHVLVAEDVAPIFAQSPIIKKVWSMPRTRGRARLSETLPMILALRKQHFDYSIDFVGNDRGGLYSLLVAAKQRFAALDRKPNLFKKVAYTKTAQTTDLPISWVNRNLAMLSRLLADFGDIQIQPPMKIQSDSQLKEEAQAILRGCQVICHLGTSQPKKEWPIDRWYEFYQLATSAGYKITFSSGANDREQGLMRNLKVLIPELFEIPSTKDLSLFLAILNEAKVVISGDTGPLHFAAGLGVKVIGLFGTTDSVVHAAPIYQDAEKIIAKPCTCLGEKMRSVACQSDSSCMYSITPKQVFDLLKKTTSD